MSEPLMLSTVTRRKPSVGRRARGTLAKESAVPRSYRSRDEQSPHSANTEQPTKAAAKNVRDIRDKSTRQANSTGLTIQSDKFRFRPLAKRARGADLRNSTCKLYGHFRP
jgi:hypothetical protein